MEFIALKMHLLSTVAMTGIIWMVQLVHYPLFDGIGEERFRDYHARHTSRITLLVAPLMLLELATGLWLLNTSAVLSAGTIKPSMVLLAVVWLATAIIQVPQHNVLSRGYTASAQRALVVGNWVRTAAWTGRSILLLAALPIGAP